MSNTLKTTVSFQATIGAASVSSGTVSTEAAIVGSDLAAITQLIGSGAVEALGIPTDVTGKVDLMVRNLDSTNYVTIYKDNAGSHERTEIAAGRAHLIRGAASEMFAKANTADVRIQFWVCEA